MANTPKWIGIHTAAHGTATKNYDTTRDEIDRWHKGNGWSGIGYHYVVRHNGTVEKGRANDATGAHILGMNSESIGICFSGHGDFFEWTPEQYKAGMVLIKSLMAQYLIPADHVIGHREMNDLIKKGLFDKKYAVHKTCPGKQIDMNAVRETLTEPISSEPVDGLVERWGELLFDSIRNLYRFTAENPNTFITSRLNEIRKDPTIDKLISRYKAENGE